MTYLAFLFATGLLMLLGPGGPVHRDDWFRQLQQRVDAIEPQFWLGFVLLIVAPSVLMALVFSMLEVVIGGAAMLLLGTAALYFSFGRADYDALIERFNARCSAGDYQGGALVLEEAGASVAADDVDELSRHAARVFVYEGFQRWFAPVFYFILLGPFWAVAYRLLQLSAADPKVPVGSLRHLIDWLPSRALLITIMLGGDFSNARRMLREQALDPDIETDELLLQGVEFAQPGSADDPVAHVLRVRQSLQRGLIAWVVVVSLLSLLF